jgi:hypothetical protein
MTNMLLNQEHFIMKENISIEKISQTSVESPNFRRSLMKEENKNKILFDQDNQLFPPILESFEISVTDLAENIPYEDTNRFHKHIEVLNKHINMIFDIEVVSISTPVIHKTLFFFTTYSLKQILSNLICQSPDAFYSQQITPKQAPPVTEPLRKHYPKLNNSPPNNHLPIYIFLSFQALAKILPKRQQIFFQIFKRWPKFCQNGRNVF